MDKYKFGSKLCSLREEKGLTQKDLATLLDVSDKAISKWENGQSIPRMETLEKLSSVFGTTLENLLSDDETELERHRVKRDIFKNSGKSAQNVFFKIGIGSVVLTIGLCIFDLIVSLAFGGSNLVNQITTRVYLLSFPLCIFSAYAFIGTYIVGFISGVISNFRSSPNCIEAENKNKTIGYYVHMLSALLVVVPTILSFSWEHELIEYIILYLIICSLLTVFFMTMKFKNICVYFTENGLFEESVNYGNFHTYSSLENVIYNKRVLDFESEEPLELQFNIKDKKYKVVIDEGEQIDKVLSYLNLPGRERKEKSEVNIKPHPIFYILIVVGFLIIGLGFVLLFKTPLTVDEDVDYTQKYNQMIGLYGDTSIIKYDDKLFCFSEQNAAVNVFDLEGNFLYANCVPNFTNGQASMYLANGDLLIEDRNNNFYKYDLNGKFLGRSIITYSDDGNISTIILYDSNDKISKSYALSEDEYSVYNISYFDKNKVDIEIQTGGNIRILRITDKGKDLLEKISVDDQYYSHHFAEDIEVVNAESTLEEKGASYYVLMGSLYKTTDSDLQVLHKESLWNWYSHSVGAAWLTGVFGGLFVFIVRAIYRFTEKKKFRQT